MATMTLVDGVTPLTPQQLGLMGMEALETVVGYWEDALTAYNDSRSRPSDSRARPNQKSLLSPEETEFTRLLESILDGAYQLQVGNRISFSLYPIRRHVPTGIRHALRH